MGQEKMIYKVFVMLKGSESPHYGGKHYVSIAAQNNAEHIVKTGYWLQNTLFPPHRIDQVYIEGEEE